VALGRNKKKCEGGSPSGREKEAQGEKRNFLSGVCRRREAGLGWKRGLPIVCGGNLLISRTGSNVGEEILTACSLSCSLLLRMWAFLDYARSLEEGRIVPLGWGL